MCYRYLKDVLVRCLAPSLGGLIPETPQESLCEACQLLTLPVLLSSGVPARGELNSVKFAQAGVPEQQRH